MGVCCGLKAEWDKGHMWHDLEHVHKCKGRRHPHTLVLICPAFPLGSAHGCKARPVSHPIASHSSNSQIIIQVTDIPDTLTHTHTHTLIHIFVCAYWMGGGMNIRVWLLREAKSKTTGALLRCYVHERKREPNKRSCLYRAAFQITTLRTVFF